MAYSDYGGFAFLNGERERSREDCMVPINGGDVFSASGMWPGFLLVLKGKTPEEIEKMRNTSIDGHVVLGDGPVFVRMYKQGASVFFAGVRVDSLSGDEQRHVMPDGSIVNIKVVEDQNYTAYARIVHPSGRVWSGFSGYGIGAGLEHDEIAYGVTTDDACDTLKELVHEWSNEDLP